MVFKKGQTAWNKNLTKKLDNRISQPWLNKKRPDQSIMMKKNNPSKRPEVKKKLKQNQVNIQKKKYIINFNIIKVKHG